LMRGAVQSTLKKKRARSRESGKSENSSELAKTWWPGSSGRPAPESLPGGERSSFVGKCWMRKLETNPQRQTALTVNGKKLGWSLRGGRGGIRRSVDLQRAQTSNSQDLRDRNKGRGV